MNQITALEILDQREIAPGLYARKWKTTPASGQFLLCNRTEEGMISIGSLSIHVSNDTPKVAIMAVLPPENLEHLDAKVVTQTILAILKLPPDETYTTAFYPIQTGVKHASRRSNSLQRDTLI